MDLVAMDKKGQVQYIRWPLSIEADIERFANEEGISKVAMATQLVNMGIQFKKLMRTHFHIGDHHIDFDEGQRNSCKETLTKMKGDKK